MAESLLLPVVRGVVGKAADALVQSVTRMWGVDEERRRLERHLVYVQSLLADAEAKSETNHAVRTWMKELKAAAYQADDVLDYFQYEALRREALSGRSRARKVLSNFTSKNRLVFRYKASRDLKNVLDKINKLVAEMNTFGLVVLKEAPTQALYRQTHSALHETNDIFGRDDDKEVVVKLLLDQQNQQDVQVLPVIGMGGVGKTTLAKMVYNNHRIQNHFELKMWHCVSENFEAIPLVRSIIELATNSRCGLPDTIELLQQRLHEAIGRKRFLLILDDVWNEDQRKWEDDLKPLLCSSIGGSGSMIVVTSRSRQVASIMGTLPPHDLVCLSEVDSWELFSRKAFSNGVEKQAELVTIGRQIVNKCKGLPLALKTMGGLMSSKKQVQEWEAIADSNISDTTRGKDEVLPILKLSYKHLSSEMKQCFAFCAVFPKDYEMEKDMLIQLWMANGYIHEEGNMDLAKKGELVFNELAQRSFLQDVNLQDVNVMWFSGLRYHSAIGCKMHDLMHDLAKDVTDECAFAAEFIDKKLSIKDGVRHMQVSSEEWEEINGFLKPKSSLRTLLTHSESEDLMGIKLMSVRALQCKCTSVIHKQLINTIHLRYLDISGSNDIVRLPDSICLLYNLQSLRLNYCHHLQYLPESMATSLRKLIHICLVECDELERMPPKIGLLHNLRTLTKFIVGTGDGFGIEELKDLRHLGNRLELYNLRNVKSGSKANLHEKQNLSELLLCWGKGIHENPVDIDPSNEERVLESLATHPQGELKHLEVYGYGGLAIPRWMKVSRIFLRLRKLIISHCTICVDLPIVWSLPCLEDLSLSAMYRLTTLCRNVDMEATGQNTPMQILFPMLKRMQLEDLPELERWSENSAGEINSLVTFPQLEALNIWNCDKLASLPGTPVLTHLYLGGTSSRGASGSMCMPLDCLSSLVRLQVYFLLVDVVMRPCGQPRQSQRPLDTLRHLQLHGDDSFASIFNKSKLQLGLSDCLAFVEQLHIKACSNIVCWPVEELRCFRRLRLLGIGGCSKLEGKGSSSEEEEILPLPQLERLQISACDSLLQIPKLPASLKEIQISWCTSLLALPSNLGDLAKLRNLDLWRCSGLKALPDGMDGLTSLERLRIVACPGIERFPQGLLQRLPALEFLWIWDCPDLQRRCREGGEYFDLVASIPRKCA